MIDYTDFQRLGRYGPHNKTFVQVATFFRTLITEGLEHVVISPGSRSTPLTLSAATFTQIQQHIVLDERSAAFTALGIGKATNKPAALICTSGTAVANYFPAVIEARKSGVPMLLLTADRPARLRGTGANQTIDQKHLFGDYPVLFKNMDGLLSGKDDTILKNQATEVYHTTIKGQGPVHLNFPFEKPLEPDPEFLQAITDENNNLQKPKRKVSSDHLKKHPFSESVLKTIKNSKKTLIIIGQITPSTDVKPVFELAERLNAPVLSEQGNTNTKYSIHGFDGFLHRELNQKQLEPELILRFGRQPASKSLLLAIEQWEPDHHIYFSEGGRKSDIKKSVTNIIDWDGQLELEGIKLNNYEWIQQWKIIENRFSDVKEAAIDNYSTLTDGHVYHYLSPKIPDDWSVFIGNSFPARDQSLFGRWNTPKKFTNRGVSGIDGITSTAMGINIGLNKPGVLFTGDLSFLHDTNALLNKDNLSHPLIIVVINNQGGSLFRMLPISKFNQQFTPYFETPQQADIATLAQSYGIDVKIIKTVDELQKINLKTITNNLNSNLQLIECQTDPNISMELRKWLWNFKI